MSKEALLKAAMENDTDLVRTILNSLKQRGAQNESIQAYQGAEDKNTAMHWAVHHANREMARLLLPQQDLTLSNAKNKTVIALAAEKEMWELLQEIIQEYPAAIQKDIESCALGLCMAAKKSNWVMVNQLIAQIKQIENFIAYLHKQDEEGKNALFYAIYANPSTLESQKACEALLGNCAGNAIMPAFKQAIDDWNDQLPLLVKHHWDKIAPYHAMLEGFLYKAVMLEELPWVEYLLRQGVKPIFCSKKGSTVMHLAVLQSDNQKMLKVLLKLDPNSIGLSTKNSAGETPAVLAAKNNWVSLRQIAAVQSTNEEDSFGYNSALKIVVKTRQHRHFDQKNVTIKRLMRAGADLFASSLTLLEEAIAEKQSHNPTLLILLIGYMTSNQVSILQKISWQKLWHDISKELAEREFFLLLLDSLNRNAPEEFQALLKKNPETAIRADWIDLASGDNLMHRLIRWGNIELCLGVFVRNLEFFSSLKPARNIQGETVWTVKGCDPALLQVLWAKCQELGIPIQFNKSSRSKEEEKIFFKRIVEIYRFSTKYSILQSPQIAEKTRQLELSASQIYLEYLQCPENIGQHLQALEGKLDEFNQQRRLWMGANTALLEERFSSYPTDQDVNAFLIAELCGLVPLDAQVLRCTTPAHQLEFLMEQSEAYPQIKALLHLYQILDALQYSFDFDIMEYLKLSKRIIRMLTRVCCLVLDAWQTGVNFLSNPVVNPEKKQKIDVDLQQLIRELSDFVQKNQISLEESFTRRIFEGYSKPRMTSDQFQAIIYKIFLPAPQKIDPLVSYAIKEANSLIIQPLLHLIPDLIRNLEVRRVLTQQIIGCSGGAIQFSLHGLIDSLSDVHQTQIRRVLCTFEEVIAIDAHFAEVLKQQEVLSKQVTQISIGLFFLLNQALLHTTGKGKSAAQKLEISDQYNGLNTQLEHLYQRLREETDVESFLMKKLEICLSSWLQNFSSTSLDQNLGTESMHLSSLAVRSIRKILEDTGIYYQKQVKTDAYLVTNALLELLQKMLNMGCDFPSSLQPQIVTLHQDIKNFIAQILIAIYKKNRPIAEISEIIKTRYDLFFQALNEILDSASLQCRISFANEYGCGSLKAFVKIIAELQKESEKVTGQFSEVDLVAIHMISLKKIIKKSIAGGIFESTGADLEPAEWKVITQVFRKDLSLISEFIEHCPSLGGLVQIIENLKSLAPKGFFLKKNYTDPLIVCRPTLVATVNRLLSPPNPCNLTSEAYKSLCSIFKNDREIYQKLETIKAMKSSQSGSVARTQPAAASARDRKAQTVEAISSCQTLKALVLQIQSLRESKDTDDCFEPADPLTSYVIELERKAEQLTQDLDCADLKSIDYLIQVFSRYDAKQLIGNLKHRKYSIEAECKPSTDDDSDDELEPLEQAAAAKTPTPDDEENDYDSQSYSGTF